MGNWEEGVEGEDFKVGRGLITGDLIGRSFGGRKGKLSLWHHVGNTLNSSNNETL